MNIVVRLLSISNQKRGRKGLFLRVMYRSNKLFEINDCMEILSSIYFRMNLIQFRMSKTE
jgi:hypothetical protein